MSEDNAPNLLAEYQANIELWKHDDSLRQQRLGNFLTINTILIVALSTLISINTSALGLSLAIIFVSAFGLIISTIWHKVFARNSEYIRFRRFQLRSIEAQLPGLSTFANTYQAFYEGKPISFSGITDTFGVSIQGRSSSTQVEGKLPRAIMLFWLVALSVGIGCGIFTLLSRSTSTIP